MRFFLTITLLFCSAAVGATNYYVRPAGGSYGLEDGTSYSNAFDGNSDIDWTSTVSDGDTLYVCGTHRDLIFVRRSNLTVSLDCPDEAGVIYGSDQYTSGWSGPDGNGNYYRTLTRDPKIVVKDGTILLEGDSESTLGADEWITTLGVGATILGLVDSATGIAVNPDTRYVQPPASNDNCYVMQNASWVQVTCP